MYGFDVDTVFGSGKKSKKNPNDFLSYVDSGPQLGSEINRSKGSNVGISAEEWTGRIPRGFRLNNEYSRAKPRKLGKGKYDTMASVENNSVAWGLSNFESMAHGSERDVSRAGEKIVKRGKQRANEIRKNTSIKKHYNQYGEPYYDVQVEDEEGKIHHARTTSHAKAKGMIEYAKENGSKETHKWFADDRETFNRRTKKIRGKIRDKIEGWKEEASKKAHQEFFDAGGMGEDKEEDAYPYEAIRKKAKNQRTNEFVNDDEDDRDEEPSTAIVKAAKGYHGIMNIPTHLLTGEAGMERVDITPMRKKTNFINHDIMNFSMKGIGMGYSGKMFDEKLLGANNMFDYSDLYSTKRGKRR